ncbi:hypothetical protein [Streptomyces pinistramenti]|uniref:hypothetical protein n=1 Tax=Streptomyces pinistramenti TaxID=2884812 RepID=UPI001D085997|nr:hypothetical protein [Streptomyces pinistramenti]MCB5911133.1 hypothetical protein [Streptomyces pinistramenti]
MAWDSRLLVPAMAVAALLIAVYTVISQLTGPMVFGPHSTDVTVSPGDHFSVQLPATPDGSRWIIAAPAPDPAVLRSAGGHVTTGAPPPADPATTRYLDFDAVGSGRTDLRLLRCRTCGPGAAEEPGARSLNFRITVE